MPAVRDIDGLIKALLVMAFGGWSASIAYTGKNIADTQKELAHELAEIRTEIAVMKAQTTVANKDAAIAIDVAAQHGDELQEIRTRLLRLEARQ